MKKFFLCALVGAALLSSCSSEEPVPATTDGNVVFSATLPAGLSSRSTYDDGLTATHLDYAVYDADGANIAGLNGEAEFLNRETSVSLNLVTGKTYTVVFWASAPGNTAYTFDPATGKVTVATEGTAQDVARDAFFAFEKFTVTGAISKQVELKRPFAQINIGTSDLADFTNAGGKISKSGLKVSAPNVLNLLDGSVSGEEAYSFEPAEFLPETEAFPVVTDPAQRYLMTAFVLVDRAKSTLDLTWTSDNDTPGRNEVPFTLVPVQRNFRTNIYGALLTNPANYDVKILEGFEADDNNVSSDDITKLTEVAPGLFLNEAAKTYKVTTAEGFRYFGENLVLHKREKIELGANIDFEGEVTEPITAEFCPEERVTFDGKNFTISNVKFDADHHALIKGQGSNQSSWTGDIKNVTIDGMTGNVTKRFAGLVNNLYGSMTNVHVKNVNLTSTEGRIGALIGIHNSGVLKDCSVTDVTIEGGWSVGGMVGGINETNNRTYENLKLTRVYTSTNKTYGGIYDNTYGVLTGDINITGLNFVNCAIVDSDSDLPLAYPYATYTWNGTVYEEE